MLAWPEPGRSQAGTHPPGGRLGIPRRVLHVASGKPALALTLRA